MNNTIKSIFQAPPPKHSVRRRPISSPFRIKAKAIKQSSSLSNDATLIPSTADYEAFRPPASPATDRSKPVYPVTPNQHRWREIPKFNLKLPETNIIKQSNRTNTTQAFATPPTTESLKRTISAVAFASNSNGNGSAPKRPRVEGSTHRPQYRLHPFSFSGPSINTQNPPSPLFFSNSPRQRPQLPARFSSSEAAARMLSKTRGEDSGVKTVQLARGSFSTGSPPGLRPSPRSRTSVERLTSSRFQSPELGESSEQARLIGQIGIAELLDQDDRPTFIIDLGDATNYSDPMLHVIFTNTALRSRPGLLDTVSGRAEEPSSNPMAPRSFSSFKSWILGAAANGESLDVCLPAFVQDSVSWSCSTLRKRLRIASGTLLGSGKTTQLPYAQSLPTSTSDGAPTIFSPPKSRKTSNAGLGLTAEEPKDYFGFAMTPVAESVSATARKDSTADVVPSIETPLNHQANISHPSMAGIISPNAGSPENRRVGSSEMSVSFPNECILSAAAADNLDRFDRSSSSKDTGFFDWTRLPVSDNLPPHIQFAKSIDWSSTALGPIENWSQDLRQMCNLIMASPHPAAMYWGENLVAIYNEAYKVLAGQKHPDLMGHCYSEAWVEIWDDVKDVFSSAQTTGQATMKVSGAIFALVNTVV